MSDKIMKELPEWFVDRMREWARAILFPDGSDVPSSWPSDGPMNDSTGNHKARTPRMLGRAHDTETAIDQLPLRYGQAVRQFWLFEGRSLREHGRHRQVSDMAFAAWVIKGHAQLKPIFARQAENWRREHGKLRSAS